MFNLSYDVINNIYRIFYNLYPLPAQEFLICYLQLQFFKHDINQELKQVT